MPPPSLTVGASVGRREARPSAGPDPDERARVAAALAPLDARSVRRRVRLPISTAACHPARSRHSCALRSPSRLSSMRSPRWRAPNGHAPVCLRHRPLQVMRMCSLTSWRRSATWLSTMPSRLPPFLARCAPVGIAFSHSVMNFCLPVGLWPACQAQLARQRRGPVCSSERVSAAHGCCGVVPRVCCGAESHPGASLPAACSCSCSRAPPNGIVFAARGVPGRPPCRAIHLPALVGSRGTMPVTACAVSQSPHARAVQWSAAAVSASTRQAEPLIRNAALVYRELAALWPWLTWDLLKCANKSSRLQLCLTPACSLCQMGAWRRHLPTKRDSLDKRRPRCRCRGCCLRHTLTCHDQPSLSCRSGT
jgi:hypothetical protein